MGKRLVVVGAGAAGLAAAWSGAKRGASVTVFSAHAGSSSFTTGGLFGDSDAPLAPGPELVAFFSALQLYRLAPCVLATRQGVIRAAQGHDSALLDLAPLAGRRVGVADVERDDWDAPSLAAALGTSAWARRTRTEFVAVPVPACRTGPERRISPYDFARLHDHPERLAWLGELLRARSTSLDGWLLGSWLGIEAAAPSRLREVVKLPLGEASSPPGGPAGARFDRCRDQLLQSTGAALVPGPISAVQRRGEHWVVSSERGDTLADFVVLATGGVAAGGIRLEHDPASGQGGFRLPFESPLRLLSGGEVAAQASSLFWPSFEHRGFGELEQVGVEVSEGGIARGVDGSLLAGFAAAGDCVAGRPRSLLDAIRAGCAATSALLADVK